MDLKPNRGYIFVEPVDEIPSAKQEVGFSGKTDKHKPEQPYKFRVVEVGLDLPFAGLWVPPDVEPGDIISHMQSNHTLREQRETAGFLVDERWYLVMDFRDILGVWRS